MEKRQDELRKLKSFTDEIDNELTLILQTLQWDRKHLLQNPVMVICKYDSNHKVPPDKIEEHEKECFLRKYGYSKDDQLLPDPLDSESGTVVKLRTEDIQHIIANASRSNVSFKKVNRDIDQGSEPHHPFYIVGCRGAEPMSLERLQISYSTDERRAIHDAVVNAVPSCHDLTDLALLSGGDDMKSRVILTRAEILVELRNMRRRRTKYRVAAKSRNYSDVLRDVIRTQMEHYNEGNTETTIKETADEENNQRETYSDRRHSRHAPVDDRYIYDRYGKFVPRPIVKQEIKTERENSTERNWGYSRENETTLKDTVNNKNRASYHEKRHSRNAPIDDRYIYDKYGKFVPKPIVKQEIKTERENSTERNRGYSRENETIPNNTANKNRASYHDKRYSRNASIDDRYIYDKYGKLVPRPIVKQEIKTERENSTERNRGYSRESDTAPKDTVNDKNKKRASYHTERHSRNAPIDDRYIHDKYGKLVPRPIVKQEIKTERENSTESHQDYSSERLDRTCKYGMDNDRRDRDSELRVRKKTRNDKDLERTQKYGEHSRKRRRSNDSEEDYDHREKTRKRRKKHKSKSINKRKEDDTDKECRSDRRSRQCRDDDFMYQVKREPGQDEELNNRSRENRDEAHKHKDTERNHDDGRRRDRDASRDLGRRQDHKYQERISKRMHIKQEREDSVSRDDESIYDHSTDRNRKSNDSRYDRSYRDRNYDSNDSEIKQENYDNPSEDIYDPNKIIKEEK